METRITLNTQDLLRIRALLGAYAFVNGNDRQHLRDLQEEIELATIVDEGAFPKNVVALYSAVVLLDLDSGAQSRYSLVLPTHADVSQGRISVLAPLGTALLGYRVGDVVEWRMPGGVRRMRIEAVEHAVEDGGDPSTRHVAA